MALISKVMTAKGLVLLLVNKKILFCKIASMLASLNMILMHGAAIEYGGKEGWQTNTSAPLAGICLLRRGEMNKIEKINPGRYIEFFIEQFYFGDGDNSILNVIVLFQKIANRVPFYILECNISEEAAKCSFKVLTGQEWRKNES